MDKFIDIMQDFALFAILLVAASSCTILVLTAFYFVKLYLNWLFGV
jgi:hypothetical protein